MVSFREKENLTMRYLRARFTNVTADVSDMLIAMLSEIGYDGFEELENELLAYIAEEEYKEAELQQVAASAGVAYETEAIAQQNWNALWESNFQPVMVDNICTIRAHFHDIDITTPYEIVITPKMSFGTGHHATTQLMMRQMNGMDMKDKSVLDFGTGTGVLAIFAEMLGASDIFAVDNDEWSAENAMENIVRNNCTHISVKQGSLEDVPAGKWDIILANINRHILLQYMADMYQLLKDDGVLLLSGLLVADEEIIVGAASDAGFVLVKADRIDNWIALLFKKFKN